MMAGQVLPPGCFLDAPEMLQRQLIAHAMDAWAAQEDQLDSIPHKTAFVLSGDGRRRFPGRFIDFYRENRGPLTDAFLACFDGYLSSVQCLGPIVGQRDAERVDSREVTGVGPECRIPDLGDCA